MTQGHLGLEAFDHRDAELDIRRCQTPCARGGSSAGGHDLALLRERIGLVLDLLVPAFQSDRHAHRARGQFEDVAADLAVEGAQAGHRPPRRGHGDGVDEIRIVGGAEDVEILVVGDDTIAVDIDTLGEGLVEGVGTDEAVTGVDHLVAGEHGADLPVPARPGAAQARQQPLVVLLDVGDAGPGLGQAPAEGDVLVVAVLGVPGVAGRGHEAVQVTEHGGRCRLGIGHVLDHGELGEHLDVVRDLAVVAGEQATALDRRHRGDPLVVVEAADRDRAAGAEVVVTVGRAVGRGLDVAVEGEDRSRVARGAAEVDAALGAVIGGLRVVPVPQHDVVAVEEVRGHEQARLVVGQAIAEVGGVFLPVLLARRPRRGRDLGALVVLAQDDVDDPGDGVGPVDRRRAVLEDLDPVHGPQRDAVEVDEAVGDVLGEAVVGDAAAVEQDQRGTLAQAAERDAGAARREGVGELLVEGAAAVLGQVAQHLGDRIDTHLFDVFTVQAQDGLGPLHVDALDVRAGDFHLLELLGLVVLGQGRLDPEGSCDTGIQRQANRLPQRGS